MKLFEPKFIQNWKAVIREKGWKGFVKQYGWKIFAVIIVFYLIRDSILYIVIPFLVIHNIVTCQ